MKILLHICCAPCSIVPLKYLYEQKHEVRGLFYNPNIQPYQEYIKRLDTLRSYMEDLQIPLIYHNEYPFEAFFRNVAFREEKRCLLCYHDRLRHAANIAKKGKFDAFTTTLLYSKFQNHDAIRDIGVNAAREQGISFFYNDFREGWKKGIEISKALGMYRQQYCGCLYSEKKRYFRQ